MSIIPKKLLLCLLLMGSVICFDLKDLIAAGSTGTSGADFLEIGVGSRPLGMGEAFTAMTGDINAIYYNPAGLGTMKYPTLSIMHQELILDSRFENISVAFQPVEDMNGFLGISNSVFWVPPFEKIDIEGNETGKVYFYNASGVMAYGYSFGFVEVGGSFKYIYQKIDTLTLHSYAADVGILKRLYMYSPFETHLRNFALGMSVQNIGTKAKDDPLPRLVRLGTSYYLTKWMVFNVDMIESLIESSDLYDFTYGFQESFRMNTGVEFTYMDILSLRTGYRFNDAGTYSFGMGFNYQVQNVGFNVDASYSDAGVFGPTYSFTVGFKLMLKVITMEDKQMAEKYYQEGIRFYINDNIDAAIEAFEKCRDYNRYHKNVRQKIKDLEELRRLKKENEKIEKELKEKS